MGTWRDGGRRGSGPNSQFPICARQFRCQELLSCASPGVLPQRAHSPSRPQRGPSTAPAILSAAPQHQRAPMPHNPALVEGCRGGPLFSPSWLACAGPRCATFLHLLMRARTEDLDGAIFFGVFFLLALLFVAPSRHRPPSTGRGRILSSNYQNCGCRNMAHVV